MENTTLQKTENIKTGFFREGFKKVTFGYNFCYRFKVLTVTSLKM